MKLSERIKSETPTPDHDALVEWVDQHRAAILKGLFPDLGDLDVSIEPRWEVPVMSGSYPIGVVDIVIPFFSLETYGADGTVIPIEYRRNRNVLNALAVEVKPTIDSVGALLRQTNLYRTGSLAGFGKFTDYRIARFHWAVASPDTKWRDRITSQRMHFIKTPTPEDARLETRS